MTRDDDWVTVEGVRYVPEAPLKAEIDRLQSQWTAMKDEVNLCHHWIERLQAALEEIINESKLSVSKGRLSWAVEIARKALAKERK